MPLLLIAVQVAFKILLLTHRALTGHAPGYNEQGVSRRQPVRSLRTSEHSLVCVPLGSHTYKASPGCQILQRGFIYISILKNVLNSAVSNVLNSAVSNECWNSAIKYHDYDYYACACMHACVRTCVCEHMFVCACVRACVCARMRASVCVCTCSTVVYLVLTTVSTAV